MTSMSSLVDVVGRLEAAGQIWMGLVLEGECPVCRVALTTHDDIGCCCCCGSTYLAESERLEICTCELHYHDCQHWKRILDRLRAQPAQAKGGPHSPSHPRG